MGQTVWSHVIGWRQNQTTHQCYRRCYHATLMLLDAIRNARLASESDVRSVTKSSRSNQQLKSSVGTSNFGQKNSIWGMWSLTEEIIYLVLSSICREKGQFPVVNSYKQTIVSR